MKEDKAVSTTIGRGETMHGGAARGLNCEREFLTATSTRSGWDLTTRDGLKTALTGAGSWAALSRASGVAVSTLKSRGDRLQLRSPQTRNAEIAAWLDPIEEDEDRPILTDDDLNACHKFVERYVRFLLHEAPARIEAACDHECTPEIAEALVVADMKKRLVELVYSTHGVSRAMLWAIEADRTRRERSEASA
jgi:hypothetical protein